MAIIGFCDIHHFDVIVKKLEAEAMTFVNQVAAIVHGTQPTHPPTHSLLSI